MTARSEEVTRLLAAAVGGDANASERLLPILYDELRQLARSRLQREPDPGVTFTPTALVHEAYLRLVSPAAAESWNGRGHFFGAAAQAMRRILVERARRKRVPVNRAANPERLDSGDARGDEDLLALDAALQRFQRESDEAHRAVMLKYFTSLQVAEIAESLGVSERTIANRLDTARRRLKELMDEQRDCSDAKAGRS